jgi:hypothetical protein
MKIVLIVFRHFNISFNSKTAIGAEQTQPSNSAWDSDSDSYNSHGIEEPQMTSSFFRSSSESVRTLVIFSVVSSFFSISHLLSGGGLFYDFI